MCIYTVNNKKITKKFKNFSRGVRHFTERPKIKRFLVKDTQKLTKIEEL